MVRNNSSSMRQHGINPRMLAISLPLGSLPPRLVLLCISKPNSSTRPSPNALISLRTSLTYLCCVHRPAASLRPVLGKARLPRRVTTIPSWTALSKCECYKKGCRARRSYYSTGDLAKRFIHKIHPLSHKPVTLCRGSSRDQLRSENDFLRWNPWDIFELARVFLFQMYVFPTSSERKFEQKKSDIFRGLFWEAPHANGFCVPGFLRPPIPTSSRTRVTR